MTLRRCLLAFALASAACGHDFRPVSIETTGRPAAELGQVLDLDVILPGLQVQGARERGAKLMAVLEVDGVGEGRHGARYRFEAAEVDGQRLPVEILGTAETEVVFSAGRWTTGRLGPLRIGTTVFEIILDGESADGAWTLTGRSWESQTGLFGTFRGWRRHRFLVAVTDFSSGGEAVLVAWVRGRELRVERGLAPTSSDPVVRASGRAVFVVNRLGFDNLQRLDPAAGFATAWQASVGTGANPHDVILVREDAGYLTRYEPPYDDLAVFDPRAGTIRGTIPLRDLAENRDATPRPDRLRAAEGWVFVGLQDVDRTFTRFAEGKLAVIDPARDEVVGVVRLAGDNPGPIELLQGSDGRVRLYVALAGIFPGLQPRRLSGGVAVVDPVSWAVERFALDDDAAGGNIGALAMVSEELGYVVALDEDFQNRVLAFDPASATVRREVFVSASFVAEIEVDGAGVLAVPESSFLQPRLCLFQVPAEARESETPLGCAALPAPAISLEALD